MFIFVKNPGIRKTLYPLSIAMDRISGLATLSDGVKGLAALCNLV